MLVLALLGLGLFLLGGIFVTALIALLARNGNNLGFPIVVPRWKNRLNGHPPFDSTVEDIARLNDHILRLAVAKGYKKRDVKKKINGTRTNWIRADKSLSVARSVLDPWGRKVPVWNGSETQMQTMTVAGWHNGDVLHVVYELKDHIEDTAYAHEMGHEILEMKGDADINHKDVDMWGKHGIVWEATRAMRAERASD
jgi:hypothetical protein